VASKEAVGEPNPVTNPAFKGDLGRPPSFGFVTGFVTGFVKGDLGRPPSFEGLQVSGAGTLAPCATVLAHGVAIRDN
jgi:hypothetical protein